MIELLDAARDGGVDPRRELHVPRGALHPRGGLVGVEAEDRGDRPGERLDLLRLDKERIDDHARRVDRGREPSAVPIEDLAARGPEADLVVALGAAGRDRALARMEAELDAAAADRDEEDRKSVVEGKCGECGGTGSRTTR